MVPSHRWEPQLAAAVESARRAGKELQAQFGVRRTGRYKGRHDVQLRADLEAQQIIVDSLAEAFPGYGVLAEEGLRARWPDTERVWVIDPLDGTNNFGYGIGHCAISIALFDGEHVVLAVVVDPLLNREFIAVEGRPRPALPGGEVPLGRATVSLVTDYSEAGRIWGNRMSESLGARCKRTVSMWAPSLDLALISEGALDGMICNRGDMLDLCGGVFLVTAAGGSVLDMAGRPLRITSAMQDSPVSFVAARTPALAAELLAHARSVTC
jgi:myo-inositol-1(or 4)-monophosphatase